MAGKTKRRRIRVRSIEERMSDRIMQIKGCSPSDAWKEIRLMEMKRELNAIG
jgi:AmiR/NasT family two-component response regulator